MNPLLQNDIRQFFAFGVLARLDRLREANVNFKFDASEIYMSTFHEAMERLDLEKFTEHDSGLVQFARVFEQFARIPVQGVNRFDAGLVSASLYWLAGYTANALVLARVLNLANDRASPLISALIAILGRDVKGDPVFLDNVFNYLKSGDEESLEKSIAAFQSIEDQSLVNGAVDEFIFARLSKYILQRLSAVSIWASIAGKSSAPRNAWVDYSTYQLKAGKPIIDLWPSQKDAIAKGLLDGKSSLIITTPTSSGKTKMTELAFVNDLYTDGTHKCLYMAPYRALIGEIEKELGLTFSGLNFAVASLYGGSDANEIEVELSNRARIIIATPEKIQAVLKMSGGKLSDYKTIVLDEGHLLDSISRGPSYEFQLAALRSSLDKDSRVIFLSAVLPNSDEIALWLGGTLEKLSVDDWQPTSTRIGTITWPNNGLPRLDYRSEVGQPLTEDFFVPRLFSEDQWKEMHPVTGRMRTHIFPRRNDNGSIAAALAFQYAKSGPVIIYANRPDWVVSIGEKIVDRLSLQRPIETNLIDANNRDALTDLVKYFEKRLGKDALLTQSVSRGFALHHGNVPHSLRVVIEDAYRKQIIRLLVATNTIAQGVNFPAKTVIVHSLPRTDAPIRDFWNLAGRAGRANRETDGEVIILKTGSLNDSTLRQLLNKGQMESVESQILLFVRELLRRYPIVSEDTVKALLAEQDTNRWSNLLRTIDAHLIEFIAEDLAENTSLFNEIIGNLLATYQASKWDQEHGTKLELGVKTLLSLRGTRLLSLVPDDKTRKRYSKTGLSVDSAITIDSALNDLQESLPQMQEFDSVAYQRIVNVACKSEELALYNCTFAKTDQITA